MALKYVKVKEKNFATIKSKKRTINVILKRLRNNREVFLQTIQTTNQKKAQYILNRYENKIKFYEREKDFFEQLDLYITFKKGIMKKDKSMVLMNVENRTRKRSTLTYMEPFSLYNQIVNATNELKKIIVKNDLLDDNIKKLFKILWVGIRYHKITQYYIQLVENSLPFRTTLYVHGVLGEEYEKMLLNKAVLDYERIIFTKDDEREVIERKSEEQQENYAKELEKTIITLDDANSEKGD